MPTKKSSGLKVVQKNFRKCDSVKISMWTSDDKKVGIHFLHKLAFK